MTAPLVVGTRGSELALWQTRHVSALLKVPVREEVITTRGDVDLSERLQGKLEKGFFTEELEAALREKRIDFAVHSLKDLPTRMPPGLALGAVLERAPAHDLLICLPEAVDRTRPPGELPVRVGARVGASSLRRDSLLKQYAPQAAPVPWRGNVPTRVNRLRERAKAECILLAAAGVQRLGLDLKDLAVFKLSLDWWPTAPGQGAVAVQVREDDAALKETLQPLHHKETHRAAEWERLFLRVLEGGCATPFGAHVRGERVVLGQKTQAGWRRLTTLLPGGAPSEAFVRETLPLLFSSTEGAPTHVPLYQQV